MRVQDQKCRQKDQKTYPAINENSIYFANKITMKEYVKRLRTY